MEIIKNLRLLYLFLTSIPLVNAVQIVQQNGVPVEETGSSLAVFILTIFVMGIAILSFFLIFIFIILKIYKAISQHRRNKSDYIYKMYSQDYAQCHINRNTNMKKRNWKFLWLFFKRKPVYMRNESGFEVLGMYDGECYKKEGFYCLSLYHKIGMFKTYDNLILIPLKIKDLIISKINVEGKEVYVLDCKGIDQLSNTDYYYQPLIWDKNRKEFIDYNDEIHEKYFEKTIYRDVIKENLQQYRENIIKSLDANPKIQYERRK